MIDYKYEFEIISPEQGRVRIRFDRDGYPSLRRAMVCGDFSEEALELFAESWTPWAFGEWDRLDNTNNLEVPPAAFGIKSRQYDKPVRPPVIPDTPEEAAAKRLELDLNVIEQSRSAREYGGIVWSKPNGDTYLFDTSASSQARFTSAVALADRGSRPDGAGWKCLAVDEVGDTELVYLPLTNLELIEIAELIGDHVQKCFDVEETARTKRIAGDETVSFEEEWALA